MNRKLFLCVLTVLFVFFVVTACSAKESEDSASSSNMTDAAITTESTEATATPTSTPKPTRVIGPTSAPVVTTRVVDEYGDLQVIGSNLCDSQGNPVQLKGMSTFGLNMVSDNFISEEIIKTLAEDWGASVFR